MAIADRLQDAIEAAALVTALHPADRYDGPFPLLYAGNEGCVRTIDALDAVAREDAATAAASAAVLARVRGHAERTGRLPPLDWRIRQQLDRAPKPRPPDGLATRADVAEYVQDGRLTEAGKRLNPAARSWALAVWRDDRGVPA